jgi:hypothetical protein
VGVSEGQDLGHDGATHIHEAFTWADIVDGLKRQFGGMTGLAKALQDRAPDELPEDPGSVEKGLRRLAKSGNTPSDTYGRLLLRYFGVPASIAQWGRLMGQYHSRFADLPVHLRREQLLRWDRPPVSETPSAMWVHVGLASLAHRSRDAGELRRRLLLASEVPRPEDGARIEYLLLASRFASDEDRGDEELRYLADAERIIGQGDLTAYDRACYWWRIVDQRAYRVSRGWRNTPALLDEALALYESLPSEDAPPFAAFRRENGRAWCLWRRGDGVEALRVAERAFDHAGDGGFVRLRVLALDLMANMVSEPVAADAYRRRARRLARSLDDADLLHRIDDHEARRAQERTP